MGLANPASPLVEPHPATSPPRFPPAEWEVLRRDDRAAAGAIVGIMGSIFTIALIMYTVIAVIVAGG
jgi:hypothetical protein